MTKSKTINVFKANDVALLKFSYNPDLKGLTIPPECVVSFSTKMKVFYGDYLAGEAVLRREKQGIYADFILKSKMLDKTTSLELIEALYPATEIDIYEFENDVAFNIKITNLFLTPYQNDDLTIAMLGDRVYQDKKDTS